MTEKEWVEQLCPELQLFLKGCNTDEWRAEICWGEKLAYAHEIHLIREDGSNEDRVARYETDLLVYDIRANGDWIPRIVLECKLGGVTTHDALTYSAKAATHKNVHPYLRYGILIAGAETALPGRLIRHGTHFDFMMVLADTNLSDAERSKLKSLLADEVTASRTLQNLLTNNRARERERFHLLHRPLRLTGPDERHQ